MAWVIAAGFIHYRHNRVELTCSGLGLLSEKPS
jgi:hypothetical protein